MALMEKKSGVSWILRASPVIVGLVRAQVGRSLRGWGLEFLVPDALLVMGELAANAVTVSDVIEARVELGDGEVVLAVWDGSDARPVPRAVEISLETLDLSEEHLDDNGGWGIAIVAALASRTWVDPTPPRGKWVCAALKADR